MQELAELSSIRLPERSSHKGQNGRLLIIGGSHLFHAASLWSLTVASRIVDLVHYSSVDENNLIVQNAKEEFRNGIVIARRDIPSYIEEDDCILIGPGMVRSESGLFETGNKRVENWAEIEAITDEGRQTAALTNYLLHTHPHKQWVIDAGALQMMDLSYIPKTAILTPHRREFESLESRIGNQKLRTQLKNSPLKEHVRLVADYFNCIILVKGEVDIVSDGTRTQEIIGGNAGMTKGGTGDVLAGLIAALATMNDPWAATVVGSYINKRAGDMLFKTVGYYFNATDLADQIPKVMKQVLT